MLSIIIPLGPRDGNPKAILDELVSLPERCEIILAVGIGKKIKIPLPKNVRIVEGDPGRASQMNAAAQQAEGDFLWFLHADSKLAEDGIPKLIAATGSKPNALYYYDLAFAGGGPSLMWLNSLAVRFRSDILKIPFGDQGFCLARRVFWNLGGYDETAPYGEDHLLVWKARQSGIPVCRTGAKIWTSSRKYESGGWGKTTTIHVWLTVKQGVPECLRLLKGKFE